MIRLKYANIEFMPYGCTVHFPDGSKCESHAHTTPHYYVISHRCGYGDDVVRYCIEHEFAHLFMEERLHDRPSQVLFGLAHNEMLSGWASSYEEMAAQTFQRWLRANERPICSGVDWDRLKLDALELLKDEPDPLKADLFGELEAIGVLRDPLGFNRP